VVDRELHRLKVDIAALQETRLADSGQVREEHYTFYWQGLGEKERRLYGVGFAVKNSLVNSITTPIALSERVSYLKLRLRRGQAALICTYAPTLDADDETKTKFYDEISQTLEQFAPEDQVFVLGDFNARIGADHQSWPDCIGHFGVGKMNENGLRLLELCSQHHLCVTNTFFDLKPQHKVSWRHPRSSHWHQLDMILVKRRHLNTVNTTRSFHSADCNTDHALVMTKTKLLHAKHHSAKPKATPRLNTHAMKDRTKNEAFQRLFEVKISALDIASSDDPNILWRELCSAMHDSALESYGKKPAAKHDWVVAYEDVLFPLLEAKRAALKAWNDSPNQSTRDRLRVAKGNLQREARRCANEFWNNLCSDIEAASNRGDVRMLHQKIKVALGPQPSKVAPLKSKEGELIHDKDEQLKRWVEHYSDLYSVDRQLKETANLPSFPTLPELDNEPTLNELKKAIDDLSSGKAPGTDAIPAELLKSNRDFLLPHLYQLLLTCWQKGCIPQDMRNAKIITLYKNKGDKGDCNNYRGISLLSIAGKAFARVILRRLQILAERILPESQCGFRSGRSTIDMIFSLRQLQEKCREQQRPLLIAFVDLTKAFDTVSRPGLFRVLEAIGCPPKLLRITKSFHDEMQGTVQYDGTQSDKFPIISGVKQGCVLAPTLFGIYFAVLLHTALESSPGDIMFHWRCDGSLFNLSRLRAKTMIRQSIARDLLFADDAALVAHSEATLQEMIDRLNDACKDFALCISVKKTVILAQGNVPIARPITLNGQPLEIVQKFCYLGSTVTPSLSLDEEINSRIGKSAATFGKLTQRAWENKYLKESTKIKIYEACVLSTLLYGAETWTTYKGQERKLNQFHLRCLRKILKIKWQDKVPNAEVLKRSKSTTIMSSLLKKRLRWLGHVHRMDNSRIPKRLLYSELSSGARPRGRPLLRFKDCCKQSLTCAGIDHKRWEAAASDRVAWKACTMDGARAYEADLLDQMEEKRRRRKQPSCDPLPNTHTCSLCGRQCRSRIGLHSHMRSCRTRS